MPNTNGKPPFFQNYLIFPKYHNTVVGKRNETNNYSEAFVNLELLGLPNMMKTGPKPGWLPQSFQVKTFSHPRS